jgi:hypothetical protein
MHGHFGNFDSALQVFCAQAIASSGSLSLVRHSSEHLLAIPVRNAQPKNRRKFVISAVSSGSELPPSIAQVSISNGVIGWRVQHDYSMH